MLSEVKHETDKLIVKTSFLQAARLQLSVPDCFLRRQTSLVRC